MSYDIYYTSLYDFPPLPRSPNLNYLFAANMRTGSSLLSMKMWQTGLLGAPLEYLNFDYTANIYTRLGQGNPDFYWEQLQRYRSSANGVFGFKMFLGNYKATLKRAEPVLRLLNLRGISFFPTATVGHFGRPDQKLPWEALDLVDRIKPQFLVKTC